MDQDEVEQAKPGIIDFDTTERNVNQSGDIADDLTPRQAWCLYLSHFLSMWISRTYEYATILFIQYTFPGDLLPSSINGIAETVCVLLSSAALGRWVDRSETRIRPLLYSIIFNRSALVICCGLWLIVFSITDDTAQRLFFGIILALGMVEKASRMSNTLSVERDWIPTVASYSEPRTRSHSSYDLTHLNTVIRRIDIVCKFLAPLAISGIMILVEPWLAAVIVGLFGTLGCALEVWTAMFVWRSNRRLRQAKRGYPPRFSGPNDATIFTRFLGTLLQIFEVFRIQVEGLRYWFSTEVWIPSLGIAILHASVLAWSGTLITWLLNSGISYAGITVAKGVGSIFEIGSTFVFPWLVNYLSRETVGNFGGNYRMINPKDEDDDDLHGDRAQESLDNAQSDGTFGSLSPIITTAKWSILALTACLIPTLITLFILDTHVQPTSSSSSPAEASRSIVPAIPFLVFLSFSFLGRWTYDLSVTQLTQVTIPAARRSEFGGTEMALVSFVSLAHWIAAAVWHRQDDFKWLALGSVVAVAGAAGAYVSWATKRSGMSGRGRELYG